jgi:hypothetical protein
VSAQAKSVNLLPPSDFELSLWGRFLGWVVTIGRYVIIVTELVVIMAFLSRFKLDEDIRTLNQDVGSKKNFLESSSPSEANFRQTQARLLAVEKMLNYQWQPDEALLKLAIEIPKESKLSSLLLTSKQVVLSGYTVDENILGKMMNQIDQDEKWISIDLTNMSASVDKGLQYSVILGM